MKSFSLYLVSFLLLLISVPALAQIGIGTTTPAASAALEVSSTANNKGILIPRLSASQKDAIASPAEGLMVYQTTAPAGFYYYTGTSWKLMVTQTDLASGNAGSATKLATARNINGVAFDGTANITVTSDAGTLSGATLKSTVTGSSLTSVGTLANLTVTNPIVGSITGNAATATTASAVTTNANLTGDVTSVGNATTIANNAVTTATIANGAITDEKITDVAATKITGTLAVANGGTGASTDAAARTNLGLGNVDNTPDLLKPISTETQAALDLKANTETANFTKDITVNGVNIGRGNGNNGSNTRIGNQALTSNTLGYSNVAIGDEALSKNTTGGRNNAIGVRTLFNNTTGGENTAIGTYALENNTSGNRNLAIGQQTLSTNTEGIKNVALGYTPLYSNTTGSNNNAIGDAALFYNTIGNDNTGVGSRAGERISTGSQNTMIGALADVTTGTLSNATAIGYQARVAASNTIQLGNTSVTNMKTSGTITAGTVTYPNVPGTSGNVLTTDGTGTASWAAASSIAVPYTGATQAVDLGAYNLTVNGVSVGRGSGAISSNTAIGGSALSKNTTGSNNTANGVYALVNNTTGSNNSAHGIYSLEMNTTGSNNTSNGMYALSSNTFGDYNTSSGLHALSSNTTGSYNTAIGFNANVASGALTNATAIGSNATVTANNTIQLGNGAITAVNTSGTITAAGFSGVGTNLTGLPLTTGITGTLAVANGGTGLTAPGTIGNVLTSNGTTWVSAAPSGGSTTHSLGEAFGGGIVFYVTSDGLHGLIAETQNLSSTCFWMNAQNEISKSSNHSTAGKLFSDWRLPTANELDLLLIYSNATGLVPGLNSWYYWSSTEASSSTVRIQGYPSLDKTAYGIKYATDLYEVRPIRAF